MSWCTWSPPPGGCSAPIHSTSASQDKQGTQERCEEKIVLMGCCFQQCPPWLGDLVVLVLPAGSWPGMSLPGAEMEVYLCQSCEQAGFLLSWSCWRLWAVYGAGAGSDPLWRGGRATGFGDGGGCLACVCTQLGRRRMVAAPGVKRSQPCEVRGSFLLLLGRRKLLPAVEGGVLEWEMSASGGGPGLRLC